MSERQTLWRFDGDPLTNLLGVLQPILAEAPHQQESHEDRLDIRFHYPRGGEYRFTVSLHSNGEASVGAQLLSDPDAYFWYVSLESFDFPSPQALAAHLSYLVRTTLSHRTRIVQERGTLFHSFKAEALITEGWKALPGGGHAFRGGGFRVPELHGDTRTYQAPALLS